jgi:hypothetical protein
VRAPPGRRAAAGLAAARAFRALGAAFAFAGTSVALPWCAGQALGDRWTWSQWLFWVPAWSVAAVTACAWLAARRWGAPGRVRRAVLAVLAVAAAWAGARSAWTEFGWAVLATGTVPPGAVAITHWNPQWPGERALEAGAALATELGDVAIITSPGSLLRVAVRDVWLPEGYRAIDLGAVAIVSRLPVSEARIVSMAALGPKADAWLAWFRVRLPSGALLGVLAVDLPSQPLLARGDVAATLRQMLAGSRLPAAPDVVLGDLNSTPGSEVWRAIADLGVRPPPPWRSTGWLCSYSRPWPMVRIDAMFAGPRAGWESWRTLDLGIGRHRAQRGVLSLAADPAD